MPALAGAAAEEIGRVVARVDPDDAVSAVAAIVAARRVFLAGSGRSGLVARAVAMRLMHTGLSAYSVGEAATPAIGDGDLLVAVSATGGGAVVEQARTARRVGADVLAVTAAPEAPLAGEADRLLVLPARTAVPTIQHAGSLFEQSTLVLGDALCLAVRLALGVPESDLDARHANLA